MPTTAETIADNASAALVTANASLNTALASLQNVLGELNVFNTPAINLPNKPTIMRTITLTALTTQLTAIQTALSNVTLAANELIKPVFADLETPIWNEAYWGSLKTTLTNMIGAVTNNTNVDALIVQLTNDATRTQSALYSKDLERKQQVLRDAFSAADAATGHSGFTYPTSMTTALKLSAQQQHAFSLAQTARDLITQIFEWAKTSYQYAISKQVDVHAADVEFNLRYRQMAESAYADESRRLLLEYETKMSKEMQLVEQAVSAYRVAVDAAKLDVEVGVKEIDLQIQQYSINLQSALQSAQLQLSTTFNYYNQRLTAADSAVRAASAAMASSGQLALGVFNAS